MLCALAAATGACSLDNPGVPPDPQVFQYPIAAAVAPDSHYLYVANSDYNLAFNGGLLNIVDLDRVRQRMAECGMPCPPNIGNVVEEQQYIQDVPGLNSVRVNPFTTDMALRPGRNGGSARLYLTVRGDGSLTWIDLTNNGASLSCGASSNGELCDTAHRVGQDPAQSPRGVTLPPLPVALSADPDGFITVAHQETPVGRVSLFYDPPDGSGHNGPILLHWVTDLVASPSALLRVNPDAGPDEQPYWYTFSRGLPVMSQLYAVRDPANLDLSYLYQSRQYVLPGLASDTGVRAVVRDPRPGAHRAFATARPPGAATAGRAAEQLLRINMTDPVNPLVDNVMPLPAGPSHLVAITDPDQSGPGHTLVYTVSYDARRVYAIDGDDWQVVAQIHTQPGPHVILADPTLASGGSREHPYLYLVDFISWCIEVIDVGTGPAHDATRNQVVFTIGDVFRPRETL
jgi:hypothetical protein